MRIILFLLTFSISSFLAFPQDSENRNGYSEEIELLKFARELRSRAKSENVSELASDKLKELNRNTSLNLKTVGAENAITWEAFEILKEVADTPQKEDNDVKGFRVIEENDQREIVEVDDPLEVNDRPVQNGPEKENVFRDAPTPVWPYVLAAAALFGIVGVLFRSRKSNS
jgi:hypothetical protein